jgi:hypothetical protein
MLSLQRHEYPVKVLEVSLAHRDSFGGEAAIPFQVHHQILSAQESENAINVDIFPHNHACNIYLKLDFEMARKWVLECEQSHSHVEPPKLSRLRRFMSIDPVDKFISGYIARMFLYLSDALKASSTMLNPFSYIYESSL